LLLRVTCCLGRRVSHDESSGTVEIIPAGISLDYVAELRAKRANRQKKGDLGSENTGGTCTVEWVARLSPCHVMRQSFVCFDLLSLICRSENGLPGEAESAQRV
jgi:hypothetical protein